MSSGLAIVSFRGGPLDGTTKEIRLCDLPMHYRHVEKKDSMWLEHWYMWTDEGDEESDPQLWDAKHAPKATRVLSSDGKILMY